MNGKAFLIASNAELVSVIPFFDKKSVEFRQKLCILIFHSTSHLLTFFKFKNTID